MMDSLLKRIEKSKKAHGRWIAMILCLSMLVSLGTFAGFRKTAVAKVYTREVLDCPYTYEGAEPVAHVHNDDCYDGDTLVCTLPELEAHTHSDACYTERQVLTCTLEENPGHQHTDACYVEHKVQSCGLEENPGHVHNGTCYNESGALICQIPEGEGAHTHTDDCYTVERELTCVIPEGEGAHTHGAECYETVRELTCGKAELTPHVHGPECIRKEEITVDEPEETVEPEVTVEPAATVESEVSTEPEVSAQPEVSAEPEVTAQPEVSAEPEVTAQPEATTVPEMPVSDPNADLESASDWERDFDGMELSGNWAEDLVLVAATQQGHGESQNNFEAVLNDAGDAWVRHGYTRYGAWSGAPYAEDWSAMFVSFCLRYAGIPAENVPNNPTAALMAESFQKGELFAGPDYLPAVGDLIFFDTDDIDGINHMGIVYHVNEENGSLNAVEGGRTDVVETFGYKLDDEEIAGYGILPQNPDYTPVEENTEDVTSDLIVMSTDEEEEKKETEETKPVEETKAAEEVTAPAVPMPAQSWERTAGGIKVTVEAPEGAFPENTKIAVTPVNGNSLKDTVSDAVSGEVLEVQAVDITFFDADGNEIEPALPIRVVMTPAETQNAEEKTNVVHIDLDQQTAEVIEQAAGTETDNSEVVFDANAFTIYAIVYTYQVEYEYEVDGKTFTSASMPGAENMPLSEIVKGLGIVDETEIDTFVSKIASIASTNEEVAIVNENNEIRVLKDGEAKIVITMQDGAKFHIDVRAEGETSASNETATVSTVGELYLPAEAELKTEVLDEVKSESAIAAVEAKEGTTNSNAAAASAYQVFDISLENVPADQYDGFQVEVKLPENVIGRDFHLYHIHDGETTEINLNTVSRPADDTGLEVVSGFTFETNDFSEFVLKYTVDFSYEGRTWSFPGQGSYRLTDVLGALGIDGNIDKATLTLLEGEYREGALYITLVDGEYYISSEVPFTDTYELLVTIGDQIFSITVTDAAETTNLGNLVTNFQLEGATPNGDGTYTVKPGKPYSVNITFTESEKTFQFSDSHEMEYALPQGVDLQGISSPFAISVNYLGNNITINGNTARIQDGKLYIKFNTEDPNFSKLSAITTTQITVHSTAVFNKSESGKDITIPGGGTYHVDGNPDVNISKSGKITDFDNGKVVYTLNLTSNGVNDGITVEDTLNGTALTGYEQGSIKLYKNDVEVTPASVSIDGNGKSFTMNTGALEDGNYQIKYTVNLDKTQLQVDGEALGKADDTKNTVEWGEKSTDHNLGHVVEKRNAWKGAGSSTTDDGTGKATTPWTITAYTTPLEGGKLTTIKDEIKTDGTGVTTKYSGAGFDVRITDVATGKVVAEKVHVDWPDGKTDTSWTYDISQLPDYPNDGTKYWRYDITYTTETDMSRATQSQTITNEGGPDGDPHTGTGTVYPPTRNRTGIEKSVVNLNMDAGEVTWRIRLTIPANGFKDSETNNAQVTELLPSYGAYHDTYVENSFSYESGQLDGDGNPTVTPVDENGKTKVTFTWADGFAASGTDNPRTVVFTFKSKLDPNWLADENTTNTHVNEAIFNNDHRYASVNTLKPMFQKVGSQYIEENGEIYFDFDVKTNKITEGSFGADGSGSIAFTDTFDSHLEYVNGSARLYGSNDEYNISGGENALSSNIVSVDSAQNKVTFTVSRADLPKTWVQLPDGSWTASNELYSYYRLHYRMKVKNAGELTSEALQLDSLTVKMDNKVVSPLGDSETTVEFTPKVLDKWQSAQLNADQANHKGKVQFTIHVNESQLDLVDGDVLTLYDKLENISTAYQDISITFPKGNYDGSQTVTIEETGQTVNLPYYNMKGDTVTFYLPDGIDTLITYWAKPTGEVSPDGKIHYTNTATLKNYEKVVEESAEWAGDESGLATQYGVRLYKADGYVNSKLLAGAQFKLFIVDEEDEDGNILSGTPLKDMGGNDKIFTTNTDGTINIEGKKEVDGWNLKPEQRYYLMEVKAPDGFAIDTTKYSFIISAKGYTNYTRNAIVAPDGSGAIVQPWTYYNGDVLTVKDWPKDGELVITKNFDPDGNITAYADLSEEQRSAITFEIYQKQKDESWKLFEKVDFDQFTLGENQVPSFTAGNLPAGTYKVIEVVNDTACKEQTYAVTLNTDNVEDGELKFVTINITDDDIKNHNTHSMTVTNKYVKESEFKIYKYANQGLEGSRELRLAGAEFGVFEVENGTATETQIGENYKTNGRGLFSIKPSSDSTGILYDTVYALKEVKAPDGYQLSSNVRYFCFLSQEGKASNYPENVICIPYNETKQEDIPNDIGTTSIGVKKIWQNEKLEEDTQKASTSVEVYIYQKATLDKAGKNIVKEKSKYYPTDNVIFTATKNGDKWDLSTQADLPDGVSIQDGRLTGLPKMMITDDGIPLYYHYSVEEKVPEGYTAVYATDTADDGSTTVNITNRPSSVQSFVQLKAEKKWFNAAGDNITSSMGANDGVTVDVYRRNGVLNIGTILDGSEVKSAADLYSMVVRKLNGDQCENSKITQPNIAVLPGDQLKVIIAPVYSNNKTVNDNLFEAIVAGTVNQYGDASNDKTTLTGTPDTSRNIITYQLTAETACKGIGVKATSADVKSYTVTIENVTGKNRTQILKQSEAASLNDTLVQTIELNKANNWRADSNTFSGGSGDLVYSYYIVERDGANYDAQYEIMGDTVLVKNIDKRLHVNKKWFRPDATTEIENLDGSITYEVYQVTGTSTWSDTYSGTGNFGINASFQFVDGSDNKKTGSVKWVGTIPDKIKTGSDVEITLTIKGRGNEGQYLGEKTAIEVSGGTATIGATYTDNTAEGNGDRVKKVTVSNVGANIGLSGFIEINSDNIEVEIGATVLREPSETTVENPDGIKIGTVTMTFDSATGEFSVDKAKVVPGKENWSSIISKLPDSAANGNNPPVVYSYRIVETSWPENYTYDLTGSSESVTNADSVVIKNIAKPAKVRVTKSFDGVVSLPENYKITNSLDSTEFTVTNKTGGTGTASDPYYWEMDNLVIGQQVTFYEWNFGIEEKEMTVEDMHGNEITSPYKVTATAVESIADSGKDTPGVTGFVNKYGSQDGALKLTKAVTVNGNDPTDANKTLTDGTYEFTIAGVADTDTVGVSRTVKITFKDGNATSYQIDSNASIPVTGKDHKWTVEVTDLPAGVYKITETSNSGNKTKLSKIKVGDTETSITDESTAEQRIASVTVEAGKTGPTIPVNAIAEFTNDVQTGSLEIKKNVTYNGNTSFNDKAKAALRGEYTFTVYLDEACETPYQVNNVTKSVTLTIAEDMQSKSTTVTDLPVGNYWIKETESDNGVYPLQNPIPVTVTANSTSTASATPKAEFTNNYTDGPDEAFISVTKKLTGIKHDELQKLQNFKITVKDNNGTSYELTKSTFGFQSTGDTIWSWKIPNIPISSTLTYTVEEEGYKIEGYNVTPSGFDQGITLSPATMDFVYKGKIDTTNSHTDWDVDNTIFAASLTKGVDDNNKSIIFITKKSLSLSQRKAVKEVLIPILAEKDSGGNWTGIADDHIYFYSVDLHPNGFAVAGSTITFDVENKVVKFGDKSQWKHVAYATFTVDESSESGDINVTNAYSEIPVAIDIIKVAKNTLDSETKTYLEGAEFTITQLDENGSGDYKKKSGSTDPTELFFKEIVTTDKNGKGTCNSLLSGYYEIKETKAPGGYVMTPEAAYIKVSGGIVQRISKAVDDTATTDKDESKVVNWPTVAEASTEGMIRFKAAIAASGTAEATNAAITVGNDQGVELPQTGGIGTTLFTALGGLMTTTAGAILTLKSYRRRKQNA